jgi:Squalene-hopene cyclase C-terminal domain
MVFTRRTDAYFIHSKTTARGVEFLHNIQQPEGGWPGYWGICFTYATMFALQSLCLAGETYETSDSVRRACDYLVSKQRADGGWGESYKVCDFSTLKTIRTRLSFLGTVMRRMCMGRARKHPGGPNVLGSDGTHVRKVPICGADRKSCEIGHVAPAAGLWFQYFRFHSPSLCRSRTARGHKRPSKGSSVGLV